VGGALAEEMVGTTLIAIALSIVLHGISATPLMARYQQRRPGPAAAGEAADPTEPPPAPPA
jgi:NhaP-type Na+/H+ or K+/H+ antiporter